MKNLVEIDIPKMMEASASHQVVCDSCGTKIGNYYPKSHKSISVRLDDTKDGDEYPTSNEYHYCTEGCLLSHLKARAK